MGVPTMPLYSVLPMDAKKKGIRKRYRDFNFIGNFMMMSEKAQMQWPRASRCWNG